MRNASRVLLAAGLITFGGALAVAGDDIAREGSGDRRAELDNMELSAFPTPLYRELSDWRNVESFDGADAEGKVVVLVMWSSWYKTSLRALPVAQQIHDKFAGDVVVIGVHHPEGYEGVDDAIAKRRVTFPVALDSGKVRSGLLSDQDPDIYIIDRAGNMRFADVETGAAMSAVRLLVDESADDAKALPTNLEANRQLAYVESRKGSHVSEAYLQALRAEVPFEMPEAEAFADAEWPKTENEHGRSDQHLGKLYPDMGRLENVVWLSEKPELKGKVMVIDHWATWCGPCKAAMPKLEALQKSNEDSLAIIGVTKVDGRQTEGQIRSFVKAKTESYYNAFDESGEMGKAIGVSGIPHVAIMSSDGTMRWQGNPHDKAFGKALKLVLANDPGVKARAEARKAYIAEVKARENG